MSNNMTVNGDITCGRIITPLSTIFLEAAVVSCTDGLVTSGDMACAGNLTVVGDYPGKPWVSGKVDGSDLSILKSNGLHPFTVTRSTLHGTGMFKISWTAAGVHPDGADYVVMLTSDTSHVQVIADAGHLPASMSFELKCTTSANSVYNAVFWFMVMS